jgi:hypothetical protein
MTDNSEIYIAYILGELNEGKVFAKDVLTGFCNKFQKSERTFATYWKRARNEYSKQREVIEKVKLTTIVSEEKKTIRAAIKSREDLLAALGSIIEMRGKRIPGTEKVIDGVKVPGSERLLTPSFRDMVAAIRLYAEMQGYFTPTKPVGNEVYQQLFEKLNAPGGQNVHDY